ncbi:hypothetical protein BJ944DRAFT_23099 [Cunninghamella echinulata]|nr:hypothetical protein BJ944DRAFT_23099 [Cunninghamella echinulata]
MGKITYGIKLAKSSPFAEEIKGRKRKLKQYTQENNEKLAGRVLLDLADLYLNQAEYIDPEDPTSTQGYYRQQDLEECLNYCKKAIKVFKKKKLYRYLARTYIIMIQCYHKIPDFDNGILINVQLLDLFRTSKSDLKDNSLYQQAYKLLADAYFTHGHSDNRKFKDFKYAEQFYEKERKIILKMTADNVGGDQLLLKDIKRSSNFNIGVIKSKLSYEIQDISEPIKYLMDAIEDAKQLKDYDSERKTWWELGNLYSGRGKWELTLDCRLKELELTKKYQLGDQLAVMIEVAKIYIMMESYSACMELCRDMRSWANSIYSNEKKNEDDGYDLQSANDMIQAVVDMVHKMRDQRRRFKQLINNYDTIESAKRCNDLDKNNDNNSNNIHGVDHKKLCLQIVEECLSLSELFGELELAKPALDIIDTGLKYCKLIEKQDQMGEDYLLYVLEIELLETKANIYMTWFFTSLTMLEDLNQQIVENAKKYIKDEIKQMDIMIDAFERFTQIYYYFDDGDLYEKWMKITKDTKIRYNSIMMIWILITKMKIIPRKIQ